MAELRSEIGHILGIDSGYRLIVVGAGHLGHALLQNFDFQKVGFQVDTAFDVSPALIGTKIHDVTIRPMEELEHYVEEYHPNVAVLTVPQSVAQPLASMNLVWQRPATKSGWARMLVTKGMLVLTPRTRTSLMARAALRQAAGKL